MFRCRLYKTGKDFLTEKDMYAEVWDTLGDPYDESDLPKGELDAEFCIRTEEGLREIIDARLEALGFPLCGSWNYRGMI